jgi:hypothetical protein
VLNKNVIEMVAGRSAAPSHKLIERASPYRLPDVPVLPETLLRMDLSRGGPSICLQLISDAVLGDLGATLQLFRSAGHEREIDVRIPNRIEDCISSLGIEACTDVICRHVAVRVSHRRVIADTWAHAREIAMLCSHWAEMNSQWVCPVESYLVGLFHELGTLPMLLGWDLKVWGRIDQRSAALRIAAQCSLPRCVTEYFSEARASASTNQWLDVVAMAHQLAASSSNKSFSGNFSIDHEGRVS